MKRMSVLLPCFLLAIVLIAVYLMYSRNVVEVLDTLRGENPAFSVVLNEYAPAEWNQGYGHYDLSILSDTKFACRIDGDWVECGAITLSYGPMDGDNSPARINFYTDLRTDRVPDRKLVVYEGLSMTDFETLMRWFMGRFACYDSYEPEYRVFRVKEKDFKEYSVAWKKNCATAALRLIEKLPGINDPQKNSRAGALEKLDSYFMEMGYK